MPTEIKPTIEATDNPETKGLTLRRIRIEEGKSDIPSGILISD